MTHYAVLGNPVHQSLSPRLFKLFAEQTKQTLNYQAIQTTPQELPAILARLRQQGYQGVNLTSPLKEPAFLLADTCSPAAYKAKAINVLTFKEDGTSYGDNSDGVGLIRDLTQIKNYAIKDKAILILGTGGAVRGIMTSLLEAAPRHVVICNRDQAKADLLIKDFQKETDSLHYLSWSQLGTQRYDLIIQCTTAALQGQPLPLPPNILNPDACCYDLTYGKAALPFLSWAKQQGAAYCYDGLGMLIEQAAQAFYWWRGHYPNTLSIHRFF